MKRPCPHFLLPLLCLSILLAPLAFSSPAFSQEQLIKKRFEEKVTQGKKITSVKKSPFPALYEVRIGSRILYTDSQAQYLLNGNLFDIETRRNYTQESEDEFNRIPFATLPLQHAIKRVRGKGERVVAVFSDPNCGYCKQLESLLREEDNLTVYLFPLNILEGSSALSRDIWCADNREKAWAAWMLEDKRPGTAGEQCTYSDQTVRQFATKHDITGTPVLILKNGARITGLPSREELGKILDASR
ncbi:MAG: DsbC family protein [Burkholderiaceae bacterium]|jgi:thiol:disulfide interchange protein DsbC|nr:DsbC family protein [Burkholderiaceae bacterium]